MNYVEEILESSGSPEDQFYAIADIVADKKEDTSFDGLKVEEKNIYMIDVLLSQINNGGLDEYFFGTSGEFYQDTINLLKMLKQFEFAEILHQASIIYFGDTNEEDKFDMLNEFDEKIYRQVDMNGIYTACLQYLRSYSQKFN